MESINVPATLSWWRSRLPVRALTGSEAVRYGRGLLLTTGLVVSVAMPLLHPTTHDLLILGVVSAGMTTFMVASLFIPWEQLPDRATVAFPIAVMIGLAAVGHFTRTEIGTCFSGLFVFCFAYLGVCERQHTVFYVLPLASPVTWCRWAPGVQLWGSGSVSRRPCGSCSRSCSHT
jgi:hypothetical protein